MFDFSSENHTIKYGDTKLELLYQDAEDNPVFSKKTFQDFLDKYFAGDNEKKITDLVKNVKKFEDKLTKFVIEEKIFSDISTYVPAERNLLSILSAVVWSIVYSDINLPKSITYYGRQFEEARNSRDKLDIPFLHISYERKDGQDFVEYQPGHSINLSQSASGYQSIIPLLLVVEHQRQQSQRRFIIEEPELNLYPTAQKDLIYSLMGGLDPTVEYKDAEWVITTHSPYILTSFNTLMLAYKVAQKSDELRAEVEKIIPARCWINPDEFAAYYADNGTVRNIMSEKTGMIADSELDNVSEDFAGEQDQLLDLYRSVPSA